MKRAVIASFPKIHFKIQDEKARHLKYKYYSVSINSYHSATNISKSPHVKVYNVKFIMLSLQCTI